MGQAGKLQSTRWRRAVQPLSPVPLYTGRPAGPGHRPPSPALAVRALHAEHFGLVVAGGRHHDGGIPGGGDGAQGGAGGFWSLSSDRLAVTPGPSCLRAGRPAPKLPGVPKGWGEVPAHPPRPPASRKKGGLGAPRSLVDGKVEDFGGVPPVLADHLPRAGVPEPHGPVQAAGVHHGRALLPQQLHDP